MGSAEAHCQPITSQSRCVFRDRVVVGDLEDANAERLADLGRDPWPMRMTTTISSASRIS